MSRSVLVFVWSLAALMPMLIPGSAFAQKAANVSQLAQQLRGTDDRVRTQAALALGASGDEAAVKPLCDSLGDSNTTVKVAVAAALGKLGKPSGLPCLQKAESKESVASVKAQIQKSIASIKAGGGSAPAPPGPDTKFYVAIEISNKSGRPEAEVEPMVRAAMQSKVLAKAGYAVAPKGETLAQGGKVVNGSKKLKGFYLIATVEPPIYAGGNLTQVVRVSMWTYPGKALQGEFAPKLTQSDTPKTDKESENVLMKMCVENAIETFQKVVASL
ncbi:HEAT repeat domain-containing protein [Chondromyces apiculatus]|uniref:PBS lyase HEAT repeat-like domain protein n=1 Tax=Chondromyces apiculatus DSM 436 TaxID=1192034 RepID=A0A017TES4_9BACT|nr:HEAT repeat domain-containing protein [Chondromyces apiculatus]EYF07417.1 PBS lyase HEAT repeat-like domain protein [Chondromyces apiculatus DSM 436]